MSETEKFTEDILTVAREKAQAIIKEAKAEAERNLEEAKVSSSKQAQDLLSNTRADAEATKRRHVSEVRHRLKLQEQDERSKILTEVLEEAKVRVREDIKNDNKYLPYLRELISSGVSEIGSSEAVIHLNSLDLKRINRDGLDREVKKKLGNSVKLELSSEPVEAIGGAIISSKDGRTRIVNTLDQRFDALEPRLLIEAGKILFGQ